MKHSHLIITANLGSLKAYRILESSVTHRRGAELVTDKEYASAHQKLSDMVSDRAGRFKGSGVGNSPTHSFPEDHHLVTEIKEDIIRQLAHDINSMVAKSEDEHIYLALPQVITKEVNRHLEHQTISRISVEHAGDIVKEPVEKIRTIFSV
jgi:hypothetical protein